MLPLVKFIIILRLDKRLVQPYPKKKKIGVDVDPCDLWLLATAKQHSGNHPFNPQCWRVLHGEHRHGVLPLHKPHIPTSLLKIISVSISHSLSLICSVLLISVAHNLPLSFSLSLNN